MPGMKRRSIWALLPAALLAFVLTGCGSSGSPAGEDETGLPELAEPVSNMKIDHAVAFSVEYLPKDVKLVIDSWGRELVLVPRGTVTPAGHESALRISTPVRRVMFTSPASIGFLEDLEGYGVYSSIAALTWDGPPYTVPALDEGFASEQIIYISPESWTEGDIEAIMAAEPDIVFLGTASEDAALAVLLDEAGIPYATAAAESVSSSLTLPVSETYLEWVKFFAAFYNLDEEAGSIYEASLERLEHLYAETSSIPEARKPTVAVVSGYDGTVTAPAGNADIAYLLKKAGAVYALADEAGGGSVQLEMEEFAERCKEADILICTSQLPSDFLTDPLLAECKALENNRVFATDSGYQMKKTHAANELEDLVAICHPELRESYELTMYRSLTASAE